MVAPPAGAAELQGAAEEEQEAPHGGSAEEADVTLCGPEDSEGAGSGAELSMVRLSLWEATASEALGPPLPIDVDVLLLHSSVKSSLMVLVVVPSEL